MDGIDPEDIDMLFIWKNNEGEYAGSGSWLYEGKPNEVVTQDGVWSAAQMLEFFGHQKWADLLIASIEEMLCEKKVLTPDLGGTAKTSQVGDEVIRKLKSM